MMNYQNEVVLIDKKEILGVVRCALSKVDPRLVDHGQRVAYIAAKILDECPDREELDFSKLFVLCLLHDIGAYKTNEIDDMVRFETESHFDHSLYGYLFLKNTTHLSDCAEAILYHHTDYTSKELQQSRYASYAELIHLADRADILFSGGKSGLGVLNTMAGRKFNPEYVKAIFAAEEKNSLFEKLCSGEFKKEYDILANSVEIKTEEIMEYLKLLVYAIDFRSPYTVTHTADTTLISMELGKLLGINDKDMGALYVGAFLHDIGKIAIPQSLLEKPGALTPSEFDIVKTHIVEGEQILRGVLSDKICDIALRHHEKLDGSGYPLGLKAEELTLPQRIVAVSDILSALSQKRSYKEAFPKEKVVAILTDMKKSGQLCPLVVDTVCENYELILGNTEKSHDPVKHLYGRIVDEYNARCILSGHEPIIIQLNNIILSHKAFRGYLATLLA